MCIATEMSHKWSHKIILFSNLLKILSCGWPPNRKILDALYLTVVCSPRPSLQTPLDFVGCEVSLASICSTSGMYCVEIRGLTFTRICSNFSLLSMSSMIVYKGTLKYFRTSSNCSFRYSARKLNLPENFICRVCMFFLCLQVLS